MKAILTRIGILALTLLSYLPLAVLYFISRILHGLLFKLFQYRRTVIELNLMHAFPDKTSRELRVIRDQYYRHLAELAAETVKSVSISERSFRKHIQPHHDAVQLLRRYEKSGRHIFVVLGHYGNWEWSALLAGLESRFPFYALYQPSGNPTFDHYLVKARSRFGCQLISNKQLKTLYGLMQKTPSLVAFVADQTPVDTENAYWTRFMNMHTPFYKGFAALAVRSSAVVLYVTVNKVETGFYELYLNTISEDASIETEEAITEKFVRLLEKDIQNKPACWLWSHRRWKRAGISY